ncbi:CCR4-NOT transcription complex subunit 4-like [Dysidea avara]|uniref:CCR4-NOT transcription complex subunit 4-like n=1 Tax=Dysidea avara TaxID=196820 RepID=UPI0033281434
MEKKHKVIESSKSLNNVRVVLKNLVFVIGLSPSLADPEGNSLGAYITFYHSEDATKAIQAVNNAYIDGRCLKASLGTTKYCSHFLAGLTCPKSDCLFLHELGEEEASFTKEDMQLG